jgi:hypothetical protein
MKRTLIVVALIAALIAPIWAQALTTDGNFRYYRTSDGRGIVIDQYLGTATDVRIPDRIENLPVVRIGESAFPTNSGVYITSVVIPNTVTHIENDAFNGQSRLPSIRFPSKLVEIGARAFRSCYALTSIDLRDCYELTTIRESAFSDCTALTSASVARSVTTIGNYAFRGCTALTVFNIPGGRITFGTNAFLEATNVNAASRQRIVERGYTGPF